SVTPIDVERNSYFRRLSTSPPSTVYQTLQHYTVYVVNERLYCSAESVESRHYMLSLPTV
ncbi:hypothetical protein BDM02DRAFT_3124259, partial [Thelephora ganbajun]